MHYQSLSIVPAAMEGARRLRGPLLGELESWLREGYERLIEEPSAENLLLLDNAARPTANVETCGAEGLSHCSRQLSKP
jgi:hypothetical protein